MRTGEMEDGARGMGMVRMSLCVWLSDLMNCFVVSCWGYTLHCPRSAISAGSLDYNEVITNFLNPASTSIKATADDGHFAIRDFNKSTFKTLKGAFKAADIDGSGFLSLAEMRKAAVTAGDDLEHS